MHLIIGNKLPTLKKPSHNWPRPCPWNTYTHQSKFTYINCDPPQVLAPLLTSTLDHFLEMSLALAGNTLSHLGPFGFWPTSGLSTCQIHICIGTLGQFCLKGFLFGSLLITFVHMQKFPFRHYAPDECTSTKLLAVHCINQKTRKML